MCVTYNLTSTTVLYLPLIYKVNYWLIFTILYVKSLGVQRTCLMGVSSVNTWLKQRIKHRKV